MHAPVDETPFHDLNSLRLKARLHNENFLKENFVNDLSVNLKKIEIHPIFLKSLMEID
jgi:hypothetical protein